MDTVCAVHMCAGYRLQGPEQPPASVPLPPLRPRWIWSKNGSRGSNTV